MITHAEITQIQHELGVDPQTAELIAVERMVQRRQAELDKLRADAGRSLGGPEWASAQHLLPRTCRRSSARLSPATELVVGTPAPRPGSCPVCRGAGYYKLAVAYDHPQFGQLLPCACKQQAWAERAAQDLATLDEQLLRYRDCRLANFDCQRPLKPFLWGGEMLSVGTQRKALNLAFTTATAYVAAPRGWLYLYGPCGGGKTRLAASIANEFRDRAQRASYLVQAAMFDWLYAGIKDAALPLARRVAALERVPLLVIDDIEVDRFNSWSQPIFRQILNERYNRELPTVLTSNHLPDELPDERVADRIAELAQLVWLTVSSARRAAPQTGGTP